MNLVRFFNNRTKLRFVPKYEKSHSGINFNRINFQQIALSIKIVTCMSICTISMSHRCRLYAMECVSGWKIWCVYCRTDFYSLVNKLKFELDRWRENWIISRWSLSLFFPSKWENWCWSKCSNEPHSKHCNIVGGKLTGPEKLFISQEASHTSYKFGHAFLCKKPN